MVMKKEKEKGRKEEEEEEKVVMIIFKDLCEAFSSFPGRLAFPLLGSKQNEPHGVLVIYFTSLNLPRLKVPRTRSQQ